MTGIKKLAFFLTGICLIAIYTLVFGAKGIDLFKAKTYTNQRGESLPYRLLEPRKTKKGVRYPLVIFYHGAGERGNDNCKQLCNGVQLFVKPENLKNFPCYMVAPQCPEDKKWVETDWTLDAHIMPESPSIPERLSLEIVAEIIKQYPVDTNRIYLVGVSMGGFAVWDLIQRYPNRFAAAAPVCGGADETKAPLLVNIPIWAFHGAKDKLVKPIRTEHIIEAIRKAGGHPIITLYPFVGHGAWEEAFSNNSILNWIFAQKRK